jgi:hypothetical protein
MARTNEITNVTECHRQGRLRSGESSVAVAVAEAAAPATASAFVALFFLLLSFTSASESDCGGAFSEVWDSNKKELERAPKSETHFNNFMEGSW